MVRIVDANTILYETHLKSKKNCIIDHQHFSIAFFNIVSFFGIKHPKGSRYQRFFATVGLPFLGSPQLLLSAGFEAIASPTANHRFHSPVLSTFTTVFITEQLM